MSSIPNPATTDWVPLWGAQNVAQSRDVRVYRSTTQSVPSGSWVGISFDRVRFDSGGHWVVGSPTRLTCQQAGTYVVSCCVQFLPAAGGQNRMAGFQVNGAFDTLGGVVGPAILGSGYPLCQSVSILRLNAGDYVECVVYQDSGAALNVAAGSAGPGGYQADFGMSLTGGPQGLPGVNGVGVPTPVVNGQWIKGSGGAAVWSPITQADLPVNLQAAEQGMPGADYNQATAAGWYVGVPTDANRPGAYYCHVQVYQFGGPQVKQIAHRYDALQTFERVYIGGVGWQPWSKTESRASGYPNIFTGPWYGSAPPANGGVPFFIPVAGNYSALIGVTAYASNTGGMVIVYFLDGIQQGAGSQIFCNIINNHMMLTPAVVPMPNIAAGTHYLAPVHSVNVLSGPDDYGFLMVFPTA